MLEVNNRDAMIVSWSAHVIGLIVPFSIINIELEDRREDYGGVSDVFDRDSGPTP